MWFSKEGFPQLFADEAKVLDPATAETADVFTFHVLSYVSYLYPMWLIEESSRQIAQITADQSVFNFLLPAGEKAMAAGCKIRMITTG